MLTFIFLSIKKSNINHSWRTAINIYLGIDPGNKGAFALVNSRGEFLKAWPMPTLATKFDENGIAELFHNIHRWATEQGAHLVATLEKSFAYSEDYRSGDPIKKIDGIVSMHNYGIGCGVIRGCLAMLGVRRYIVSPKTWQKEMWLGVDMTLPAKAKSLQAFRRIFPGAEDIQKTITEGSRTKRPHDGIIDAVLMAEYGRRVSE